MAVVKCNKGLRGGSECDLEDGHRGRHTSVVFYCDGCNKIRPGYPSGQARNPWDGIVEAEFCFLCMKEVPRWKSQSEAGL